ncbi:hypothetical protein BKA62DRAFT_83824 [Auriculariales sp. MPI-PUGE-AT-0066]|nr:hypothetical protein BKA62DRAFT_83824 [Auriculariales sp. MPI-PUGE-AT-0066]
MMGLRRAILDLPIDIPGLPLPTESGKLPLDPLDPDSSSTETSTLSTATLPTSSTTSTLSTPSLSTTTSTTLSTSTETETSTTLSTLTTLTTLSTSDPLPTPTPSETPEVPQGNGAGQQEVSVSRSTSTVIYTLPGDTSTPTVAPVVRPQVGFFANKAAVTGTFTVIGVIVAAIVLFLITMACRRRRSKQLDREIADAAIINKFNPSYNDDDDSSMRQFATRPMASMGGATGLASRPSMSSDHASRAGGAGYAPSSNSGYGTGPAQQYPFNAYPAGSYGSTQPPVPPIPAARAPPPGRAASVEPDVYSYNAAHRRTPSNEHPISPNRANVPYPGTGTAGVNAQVGAYGSAMVPGISRYAQMQAAAAQQNLRRTPSGPSHRALTPPGGPARYESATSVQQARGYDDYQNRTSPDLKIVN